MKGDEKVVEHLNQVLRNELAAINQYFLHSKLFADWGIAKLAGEEHRASMDEMKHADVLIERILLLDALPNVQDMARVRIGTDVPEALANDLALELEAIPDLRAAVSHAETTKDYVSRDLFHTILKSEEDHVDWLETQLRLIETVGTKNFLQSWMQAG